MQGVKGTHSPGQHGTFVNKRPRTVMAGGIVRWEHRLYRHSRLEPYVGTEVLVDESSFFGREHTVGVSTIYYLHRWRNGREAVYKIEDRWIADAEIVTPEVYAGLTR